MLALKAPRPTALSGESSVWQSRRGFAWHLAGLNGKFSRKLALEIYQASTADYWRRQTEDVAWHSLGGFVQYSRRFISAPTRGGESFLLIALRAEPGRRFKRVRLSVAAKHAGVVHRDTLIIDDLTENPVLLSLPNISWHAGGQGKPSRIKIRGSLFIKLEDALNIDNVSVDRFRKSAEIFRPRVEQAPQGEFVERWGRFWNTFLIEKEKQRLKERVYSGVVNPAKRLSRPLRVRRAVYQLLTRKPVLSLVFWVGNIAKDGHLRVDANEPVGFLRPVEKMSQTKAA